MTRPHTEGFVPLESLSLAVSIPHSMWLQREARVQGRLGRCLFEDRLTHRLFLINYFIFRKRFRLRLLLINSAGGWIRLFL